MSKPQEWTPSSWRQAEVIYQDVQYPADRPIDKVISKLSKLPPLVSPGEIERLRSQLADVAANKAFLLQGGDCAELFDYCSEKPIQQRLSLLLLSSLILIWGTRIPVVRIVRGCGQYAKPRSKPTEMVDGKEVLSFRGDNVNGFDAADRIPDPERLLGAYFHAAATLNYMRSILSSGFADLHHPREWPLSKVRNPTLQAAYEDIVTKLEDSLDFLGVIGGDDSASNGKMSTLNSVDLFTSHEGLLLEYEEALTRHLPMPSHRKSRHDPPTNQKAFYNTSAHFLWIGDRTRQLNGAHVEYFRGIRNPIGIKCGPTLQPEELVRLLDIVDPNCEAGRVTLICRYGAGKVQDHLPGHIKAVQSTKHQVIWQCDPMHGNGTVSANGSIKTRRLADIVHELSQSFQIHNANNSRLNGVHLEMTGETNADGFSVTECIGGSSELADEDLSLNYQTYCDPRLNTEQTLDIAFLISHFFQSERKGLETENEILKGLTA